MAIAAFENWLHWYARGFTAGRASAANWRRILRELARADLPVIVSVGFTAAGTPILTIYDEVAA